MEQNDKEFEEGANGNISDHNIFELGMEVILENNKKNSKENRVSYKYPHIKINPEIFMDIFFNALKQIRKDLFIQDIIKKTFDNEEYFLDEKNPINLAELFYICHRFSDKLHECNNAYNKEKENK